MPPTSPVGYLVTLLGLVAGLIGIWVLADRYAPAGAYPGWPVEGVSPVFIAGAAGLSVLVLDRVGGGVLGVAVRVSFARIRMLGLLVFGLLLVGFVYKKYVLGS